MARLHLEYYKGSGCNQDKIDINRDIMEYIQKNSSEDYTPILVRDDRWQVFYHLSQMRTSILNWYEFKANSSVLEIGGEFGALTGMLCDRCQNVTTTEYGAFKAQAIQERYRNRDNLDIYAGNISDMEFPLQFDYIIMIGSLERQCGGSKNPEDYVEYINKLKKYLKPDGKILAAVENKYGLRYFCGEKEYYTKKPFGGIGQYHIASKGYTFGRYELEMILKEAGLIQQRFYYPLPDYKLTQMVYSDEYLPRKDMGERLLFYHPDSSTLLVPEQWLYSDILDNKVFHFFSNSFLVECSESGGKGTALFAAVTTDRGKEHGLATIIHQMPGEKNERLVKKRALYADGKMSIQGAYDNIMNLKQHGIPIVPHTLKCGEIVMPFLEEMTCSDYLRKLALQKDKEQFEQIFQLIYQNIMKSSEIVDSEKNTFPGAEEGLVDYGPILKYCYVDLVPFNCFYVDEKLVYFDQEFVKENYPAAYPMFRSIMYTYAFTSEAEQLVPLSVMKERYGLETLWDILSEEEQRFVADNRRYDIYQNFYRWTGIDVERMERNRQQIGNDVIQKIEEPAEILTKEEKYLAEFRHHFTGYSKKNIVLYGKGPRSKQIIEGAEEFNIIGLMDKWETEGSYFGKPILTYEDVLEKNVDIIIVVSKPETMPQIYNRIHDFCKLNNIMLYSERGEELLSLLGKPSNIVEKNEYFDINAENLYKQIEKYEVISFSLEDTLIMSTPLLHKDVETIVKKRIMNGENADLVRSRLLIQRYRMIEIYQWCIRNNKKVYLITDLPMGRRALEQRLISFGITDYAKLIMSSEYSISRKDGLFNIMQNLVEGYTWLHIGADKYADQLPLQTMKADVFLVKSALDMLGISSYATIRTILRSINERSLVGLVIANVFNDPFALYHTDGKPLISDVFQVATVFVAPMITTFMLWMVELLEKGDYDGVLFASRDGYLIQKLYKIYQGKAKSILPESKYFLTSRRAASNAGMFEEDDIKRIFSLPYENSPEDVLKDKFFLLQEEVPEYESIKYSSLVEYALENQRLIYNKSEQQRAGYLKYIKDLGIKENKKYAFFDLATSGTTQYYLERFIPGQLYGLYLLWYDVGDEGKRSLQSQALYKHMESEQRTAFEEYFRWNYAFLEPMLTGPSPSVYCFTREGLPVFGPENRTAEEIQLYEQTQAAITIFFEKYLEDLWIEGISIDKEVAGKLYLFKNQEYSRECCTLLDHYISRDDLGAGIFQINRC